MPELPEVETVRRQLNARLAGARISAITFWQRGREFPNADAIADTLRDRVIDGIERRAKLLIFRIRGGGALVGHLKMTGKFLFAPLDHVPGKHDRALFVLENPGQDSFGVLWSDVRKFGYLKFMSNEDLDLMLAEYGPEPLEASEDEIVQALSKSSMRSVKAILLDQTKIAGVGNIYADEASHRAGILPMRKWSTLSTDEIRRLVQEIKNVLSESLARKGTSANDYVDTSGSKGSFKNFLRVYKRQGKECLQCGTIIQKTVNAGRGTHFCPECQK